MHPGQRPNNRLGSERLPQKPKRPEIPTAAKFLGTLAGDEATALFFHGAKKIISVMPYNA